jgi:LacI family transcriptional regulator
VPHSLKVPQRQSLVGQSVQAIRDAITSELWVKHLPGERVLCQKLGVSRPTIRKALEVLKTDGTLQVSHGKQRTITARPDLSSKPPKCTVAILLRLNEHGLSPTAGRLADELKPLLQEADLDLEIYSHNNLFSSQPEHALATLTRNSKIAAWILISCPHPVHQWFFNHGLPTIVAGSCDESVLLPSIDLDYRAVCRHAAGQLLAKGHQRIGLIISDRNIAGDVASEAGFFEAVANSQRKSIQPMVIKHNATPEGLYRRLESCFNNGTLPTGLLVAKPLDVLTTLSFLHNHNLRVPNEISLIARDHAPMLDAIIPKIAGYRFHRDRMVRQISQLVIQAATQGGIPFSQRKLIPDFEAGKSIEQLGAR